MAGENDDEAQPTVSLAAEDPRGRGEHRGAHRLARAEGEARVERADELAEFLALYWKDGRKPLDAAAGIAMLAREICDEARLYAFSDEAIELPARRGFALRDGLRNLGHGGTYLGKAIETVERAEREYDRLIVITDEQSMDAVGAPRCRGYLLNVATYQNGVGYGPWLHIDGWSESVLDYIREFEAAPEPSAS